MSDGLPESRRTSANIGRAALPGDWYVVWHAGYPCLGHPNGRAKRSSCSGILSPIPAGTPDRNPGCGVFDLSACWSDASRRFTPSSPNVPRPPVAVCRCPSHPTSLAEFATSARPPVVAAWSRQAGSRSRLRRCRPYPRRARRSSLKSSHGGVGPACLRVDASRRAACLRHDDAAGGREAARSPAAVLVDPPCTPAAAELGPITRREMLCVVLHLGRLWLHNHLRASPPQNGAASVAQRRPTFIGEDASLCGVNRAGFAGGPNS
jgi:hypothetical protein